MKNIKVWVTFPTTVLGFYRIQMADRCSFEEYLGHYMSNRKLNRNKPKENELVFQKKPEVFKTRRRFCLSFSRMFFGGE